MKNFQKFIKKLEIELKQNLPGFSAQKLMAPLERKPPIEYLKENVIPRESAVLILVYPETNTFFPKIVLIERAEAQGAVHSGQVSFPGGSFDKSDKSLHVTALREAEEEIGVKPDGISLIGGLTPLYIPVSNFMVHPFIGAAYKRPEFLIHNKEVKEIIEIKMEELFSEANKSKIVRHIKIKNLDIEVPCYNVIEKIIWGATAMIISELEAVIKRI